MTDVFWMKRALLFANKALFLNNIPVGAVLVYDNIEIGSSFNYSGFTFCSFYHAECISLNQGSFYLSDCLCNNVTLYVTLEPCFMCMSFAFFSKIRRIVFGAYSGNGDVLILRSFSTLISLKGGLLESESKNLLKTFYLKNRFH